MTKLLANFVVEQDLLSPVLLRLVCLPPITAYYDIPVESTAVFEQFSANFTAVLTNKAKAGGRQSKGGR